VRYWGFNTVLAILRSSKNIAGELYLPARNRASHVLLEHTASHRIKILHQEYHYTTHENGSRVRYPLLITESEVSLPHIFHTLDHYLSTVSNERQLLLLFDGITDVGNIAAIMRSAYSFGVSCLITSHRTSADIHMLMQRSAGYCVVWHNERVIAKANTNIEGYQCAQLGGIFTQKQYRNLGIGYNCVTSLCELLFNHYTTLVLFVTTQNNSAISL